MTATLTVPRATRVATVDVIRGAAILLMIVDHILVILDPHHGIRTTVTRLALPGFMITSGMFADRIRWDRLTEVTAGGLAVAVIGPMIGLAPVNILLVWLAAIPIVVYAPPLAVIVIGFLAAKYHPLPYDGYQLGEVAAWLALGRLTTLDTDPLAGRFPWLAAMGRNPLRWYVAHVAILLVVVELIRLATTPTAATGILLAPGPLA